MAGESARRGEYQHTVQRRERLLGLLDERGGVSVQDLARELDVSVATVRRDLAHLEGTHRVARTYGGAIDTGRLDRSWREKSTEHLGEKRDLARWAADRVQPGSTVMLDSGTTVAELAALLGEREDLLLVTNGLSSILELADARAEVLVLGGRLRRPSESIVGLLTLQALERVTADIGYLGAEAVDPVRGINCPEIDQAAVKELMSRNARETWLLVHSSKFDREPPFSHWAPMGPGCGLVTDRGASEERISAFRDAGWRVETV
ncbi:DeoR/GlpR family DNA-binding transcription regulator [Leucobacter rhizosphaerae]|uniref:DeoR/GlpR family DNA-binding transcription regulator n=1 Tax=Leucobacter rhizosphaerae TaxID=2932245 RepID=A0ABY4FSQ6_9MICO|nr:DeoR/GlpR family DNA-binding transcription regulator [Leucobacter rhizosphaerae]UOQ59329.1 DeoR/GlpR family DNA-binding transcription regulator [Leucobacter rhizosphaerae]